MRGGLLTEQTLNVRHEKYKMREIESMENVWKSFSKFFCIWNLPSAQELTLLSQLRDRWRRKSQCFGWVAMSKKLLKTVDGLRNLFGLIEKSCSLKFCWQPRLVLSQWSDDTRSNSEQCTAFQKCNCALHCNIKMHFNAKMSVILQNSATISNHQARLTARESKSDKT